MAGEHNQEDKLHDIGFYVDLVVLVLYSDVIQQTRLDLATVHEDGACCHENVHRAYCHQGNYNASHSSSDRLNSHTGVD